MFPKELKGDQVIFMASTEEKYLPKGYVTPKDGVDKIQPVNRFAIVRSLGFDDDSIYRAYGLDDDNNIITGDYQYTPAAAKDLIALEYGLSELQWEAV